MAIVARAYRESDAEAFFGIHSLVYRNGVPIPAEDQSVGYSRAFVGELDGKVSGIAGVNEVVVTRGAANIPAGAVAGVGVDPQARNAGVASGVMRWLVDHLRCEGIPLASLYPFREPFYRKFGYEVCATRVRLTCPSARLPKLASDLPVRRLEPKDWPIIRNCYEGFARARSGFHIRTDARWVQVVNAKDFPKIYAFGDPIEAYALLVHKVEFWEVQQVAEVAWTTDAGHTALISWLAGVGANKTHVTWWEPSDSPFVAKYLDQGIELKIERPVMYRVTDVPSALKLLKPVESGEFTFEVSDPDIPENRGPWRVRYSPEKIEVTSSNHAEISFTIQNFTQTFMGSPSVLDLHRNGSLTSTSAQTIRNAAGLMPPLPVACWDFF